MRVHEQKQENVSRLLCRSDLQQEVTSNNKFPSQLVNTTGSIA